MENKDMIHIKGFLPKELADKAFTDLLNEVQWHNELFKENGTQWLINRKMAYMFETPVDYKYANLILPGTTWHPTALEVKEVLERKLVDVMIKESYTDEELQEIKAYWNRVKEKNPKLYQALAESPSEKIFTFNSVLLNLYADGKEEIRWHSDKEDQLGERPVIACINLGAGRKFSFLRKGLAGESDLEDEGQKGERIDFFVEHGDLLLMTEECQERWLHAILKDKSVKEPRISLTFRKVK